MRLFLGAMIGSRRGGFLEDRVDRLVIEMLTAAMEVVALPDASTKGAWMVTAEQAPILYAFPTIPGMKGGLGRNRREEG